MIKAQAESIAGSDSTGDRDALTTVITSSVRTTIEKEGAKTDTNFTFMKNKLVKLADKLENIQQLYED